MKLRNRNIEMASQEENLDMEECGQNLLTNTEVECIINNPCVEDNSQLLDLNMNDAEMQVDESTKRRQSSESSDELLENNIKTFMEQMFNRLSNKIDKVSSDVNEVKTDVNGVKTDINEVKTDVNSQIAKVDENLVKLREELKTEVVGEIQERLGEFQNQINNDVAVALQDMQTNVNSEIAEVKETVTNVSTNLQIVQNDYSTIDKEMKAVVTNVTEVENEVSLINMKIKTFEDTLVGFAKINDSVKSDLENRNQILAVRQKDIEIQVREAQDELTVLSRKVYKDEETLANRICVIESRINMHADLNVNHDVNVPQVGNIMNRNSMEEACSRDPCRSPRYHERGNDHNDSHLHDINMPLSTGQSNSTVNFPSYLMNEIKLPIFDENLNTNPQNFLIELHDYFRLRSIPPNMYMIIVRKALQGRALNWFNLTANENTTFEDFKRNFVSRYWSSSKRNDIRMQLVSGSYDPESGQSMIDYFLEMAELGRQVDPPLNELELLETVINHFQDSVRLNLIVAKPRSCAEMLELLGAFEQRNMYRNRFNYGNSNNSRYQSNNGYSNSGVGARANQNNYDGTYDTRNVYRGTIPRQNRNNAGYYQNRQGNRPFNRDNGNTNQINQVTFSRQNNQNRNNSNSWRRAPQNRNQGYRKRYQRRDNNRNDNNNQVEPGQLINNGKWRVKSVEGPQSQLNPRARTFDCNSNVNEPDVVDVSQEQENVDGTQSLN